MLRQELQETKETLAARDAEVQELKARVAELEQLQKEQQSLIAMKDGALASAQQRLATTNAAQDATPPAAAQPEAASSSVWWWLLPVALFLGALAWWFTRRRRPVAAPPTTRISERFAAVPTAVVADEPKAEKSGATQDQAPAATPVWAGKAKPPAAVPTPATPVVGNTPTWMAPAEIESDTVAPLNQAPGGRERIELARAYADLGDRATARTLLQEVVSYYSRTPEHPEGIRLDEAFALPANIQKIEVGSGQAVVVQ